jgi:oxygen-independent coproporphyrinogen-3 oxidase
MVPADEDTWRAMYEAIGTRLRAAGLDRYEVSNFARPGHESAHNRLYWTDRPYLGLGPSAHGYAPDGTRWIDVADVGAWLVRDDPTAESGIPSPRERAVDLLVSCLRGRDGLDLDHLRARSGHFLSGSALDPLAARDLLVRDGPRIRLGEAGFPVADAVVRHLVDRLAVQPEPD